MKSYSELITLPTFEERFKYLQIGGTVGESTFGFSRYLNQVFYRSEEWKKIRRSVIIRDQGCDLASLDRPIIVQLPNGKKVGRVIIHHINPITLEDVNNRSNKLFDLENLICTCDLTHKAIHYGDGNLLIGQVVERSPNDTCPWKR